MDLQRASFLNDQHVVQLSSFIGDLMYINLSGCENITKSSLFVLARSCPLLCEIKMEGIGSEIVENSDSSMDFGVDPRLKSLYLGKNSWLSDESIITISSIFPYFQLLDLNSCECISDGICQVLRRCCKIRHLNLSFSKEVKLLGMNFIVPNLEVLNLSHKKVDDQTLYLRATIS